MAAQFTGLGSYGGHALDSTELEVTETVDAVLVGLAAGTLRLAS
jgi:hypothetical protein